MKDNACPIWRSADRPHIKRLQVLQSKCLHIATSAPWYTGNRQIHNGLGVPYFCDHTRFLTQRFDSKLDDAGNPLVEHLGRLLRWPNVDLRLLIQGNRDWQLVLATRKVDMRTQWIVPPGTFRLPWLRVFRAFSLAVRQMPGYNKRRRGTAWTLSN